MSLSAIAGPSPSYRPKRRRGNKSSTAEPPAPCAIPRVVAAASAAAHIVPANPRVVRFKRLRGMDPLVEVWFCANFMPVADADALYSVLEAQLPWAQGTTHMRFGSFKQRRLQCLLGEAPYFYSGEARMPDSWNPALNTARHWIEVAKTAAAQTRAAHYASSKPDAWSEDAAFEVLLEPRSSSLNSDTKMATAATASSDDGRVTGCLCNWYRDGLDKIDMHSDSETYLVAGSYIASLSLGATRKFVFRSRKLKERVTIDLPSGSLVLMGDQCQTRYHHGVPVQTRVTRGRINCTFRDFTADAVAGAQRMLTHTADDADDAGKVGS